MALVTQTKSLDPFFIRASSQSQQGDRYVIEMMS